MSTVSELMAFFEWNLRQQHETKQKQIQQVPELRLPFASTFTVLMYHKSRTAMRSLSAMRM